MLAGEPRRRRRGAAKTEGLNSRHWRRETGTLTKARRAAEAAMRTDAPRKPPVSIDAVRGHFVMRWYLDRMCRYAALRKWRRLKKEEREVLAARAAERRSTRTRNAKRARRGRSAGGAGVLAPQPRRASAALLWVARRRAAERKPRVRCTGWELGCTRRSSRTC